MTPTPAKQKPNIDPAALPIATGRVDPNYEYKKKLLEKISMIRDGRRAQIAGQFRNGLAEYVYLWVYNHSQEISRYRGLGYEIVPSDDPVETDYKAQDGHHYRGDTVAMRCEKITAEAHNALRDLNAIEAIDGRKQELENWGAENGVPIRRKSQ